MAVLTIYRVEVYMILLFDHFMVYVFPWGDYFLFGYVPFESLVICLLEEEEQDRELDILLAKVDDYLANCKKI
jgi:hypothetical protein